MASYTNINSVKIITTGDEAGTWGSSTNTNLEILDAASKGFKKITVPDVDYTLSLDNNPSAVENGHYAGIEFSGTNSGERTITLEQNDHTLVYTFLNNTGQNLVIKQGDGSGGTVTIANGYSAMVFCDGAGTGAKVTDVSAAAKAQALANSRNFSITGDITAAAVGFDGTGNVALSAGITADTIVDADINSSAAIADTKLATISTASKVSNSATTATNLNTANAIVARDGSGNFAAGTVTADLTGNVTGNATGDLTGDVYASNGTSKVLESGTDGTDATFTGAVTGDVTGDVYASNGTSKVLENGTDGTDATFTGAVTGDVTGDVYASNGTSKVLENGTDGTDATFTGAVTGTVSGNAGTATALASAQNFSITGDVTAAEVSFDGTGAVALSATITADTIVNADIKSDAAIADTKLDTISTSGKVSNSATTATSANTASAIVARDASGNFSAGTITADLSGTVNTAAQPNITSLGTLTTLTVDDITIDGDVISSTGSLYVRPTGDNVYLQGITSDEQVRIYLDTGQQTISSSDALRLASNNTSTGHVTVSSATGFLYLQDAATARGYLNLNTETEIKLYTQDSLGNGTLNTTFDGADAIVAGNVSTGGEVIMTGGTSNWTFEVDGSNDLVIQYNGTSLFKLSSSGNLQISGDIETAATL